MTAKQYLKAMIDALISRDPEAAQAALSEAISLKTRTILGEEDDCEVCEECGCKECKCDEKEEDEKEDKEDKEDKEEDEKEVEDEEDEDK